MQTGAATLENSMEVPQKIKNRTTLDPAIALLGIYPRDTGMLFQRGTCTPMFLAALSTIAKVWKEPQCPSMDEWIKKMWSIYTKLNSEDKNQFSSFNNLKYLKWLWTLISILVFQIHIYVLYM